MKGMKTMKKITYVLWATKKGMPTYMEQVLMESYDLKMIEAGKKQAIKNGYENIRIANYDMTVPPDFKGAVNV